jgi:hypothetical protein
MHTNKMRALAADTLREKGNSSNNAYLKSSSTGREMIGVEIRK